jgi:hypothetical protein
MAGAKIWRHYDFLNEPVMRQPSIHGDFQGLPDGYGGAIIHAETRITHESRRRD